MPSTATDTAAIGARLIELCRVGESMKAINELYAPDVVSVEACGDGPFDQTLKGLEAVKGKNEWWSENHEVHGAELCGPFPNGERFAVGMKYEITPKVGPMAGQRMTMEEVGLYTVKSGKIVKEEFFYDMG